MNADRSRRLAFLIASGAFLVLALVLRLYGHNWDDGWYFHPDERFIVMVLVDRIHAPSLSHLSVLFHPDHSPLNPRALGPDGKPLSFAYGSLPLFVTDFLAAITGRVVGHNLNDYAHVGLFGRYLTAVLDTLTVALAMVFARRAFGRIAALLTGFLLATTVMMIQLAHFLTVDAWVTFFAMAVLLAALFLREAPTYRRSAFAGAVAGLALATKVSVVALGVPILVALLAAYWPLEERQVIGRIARRLGVTALAALGAFALFEPYAIWRPVPFLNDAGTQWLIVTGRYDVPFTRQFVGRIPVRYEVGNLVHWGLGPLFGIAALAALVVVARRYRSLRFPDVLLLSWIVAYGALVMSAEAKFLRYSEPLVPALGILTGALLARLLAARPRVTALRVVSWAAVGAVLLGTLGWAAAFEAIYRQPHPRIAASQWIYRNIPAGATITAEYWDDPLPLPLVGLPLPSKQYNQITMDLYADRPNDQEFTYIENALDKANYIILSSDRLAQSIPRLPWRYPVASQYYTLLESGQLGFQLVYESADFPRLGPFTFNDRGADESFTVYDHPHVRVYRKVTQLTDQELRARFASAIAQPWIPQRTPPSPTLLLRQPVSQMPVAHDLDWSAAWTSNSLVATAVWLVVLLLVALASLPLTLTLFGSFTDFGWGLARAVGLLAAGYLVWITVSLQLLHFRLPEILLVLLGLTALIWGGLGRRMRARLAELRPRWRLVAASEAVFFLAFAFFLTLRAINPDLWQTYFGGEKPMEMSYISAIARSATFPPYDPWYAGGAMNYYYYGFYLVALLWKLTGIPPEIGFQLAIATVGALLACGVFSLASTMGRDLLKTERLRWIVTAGLLGVLLELFVGNLDAARQLLTIPARQFDFWQSSRVVDYAITEFPYFTVIWADLHPHAINMPFTVLLLAVGYVFIRERGRPGMGIPAWSICTAVVVGSLAVVNSWDMPLAVLVAGACILTGDLLAGRSVMRALAHAVPLGAAVSFGAYLLFWPFFSRFVALVNGVAPAPHGTAISQYLIHFGIPVGILLATAIVLLLYHIRLDAFDPLLALLGALLAAAGYAFSTLVFAHGDLSRSMLLFFPALVIGALVPFGLTVATDSHALPIWLIAGSGAAALSFGVLFPVRLTAALLVIPLSAGIAVWLTARDRPAVAAGALFLAGAAGITLGADLVYVVDDLSGSPWARMNTVFKFYVEGWTLFALSAALALVWLLALVAKSGIPYRLGIIAGAPETHAHARLTDDELHKRAAPAALLAVGVSALLIAAGLLYPIAGTPARLAQTMAASPRSLTLDGLAWMKGSWITNAKGQKIDFNGDYAAIMWLRQHADGNPVIAEASIGPYRGNGARISAGTGLPSVLGWDRHERQQRYSPGIDQRLDDLRTLYNSTSPTVKIQLLEKYDVRYVIVGDVERKWLIPAGFAGAITNDEPYASAAGLQTFQSMVGTDLRVAFTSGPTTIYEVIPFPRLAPSLPGTSS